MVGSRADDRKHAGAPQRADMSASRLMAESSSVPTVHVEGAHHGVRYANEAFARLSARSRSDIEGASLLELLAVPDEKLADVERARQTFVTRVEPDLCFTTGDGHLWRGAMLIAPLVDPDEPPGALVVQLVSTPELSSTSGRDLQQANEQLLLAGLREQELADSATRSAAELAAILDHMSEGVTVFNDAGKIILVNPRGREILGMADDDDLCEAYRRCRMIREEGTGVEYHRDVIAPLLAGERFSDEEVTLKRHDGAERHILMSGTTVRDAHGAITLGINVFRDVSRMRELEQARQLYFSLISHDLRGPLSAASITTEVLERYCGHDEKCQPYVRRIRHNLDRMDEMVRNLLDAQLIRAGEKLPLSLEDVDIVAVVRDVVSDLTTLHGDRFVLSGLNSLVGVWSADQVRRAIWNLASNGVKYGAPESPVVILVERRDEWALVSVHNEGPPIPKEDEARLFAPFSRTGSRESKSKERGWGLGLTLVRGCAEAHGGRVTVQSSATTGTTFTLELPLDARPHVESD